jgi:hypothetical protein
MLGISTRVGRNLFGVTLLAIGVAAVGGTVVLGALGVGFAAGAATHSEPDLAPTVAVEVNTSGLGVHSHGWGISSGPTTTTGKFNVAAGSDIFVFIGYINAIIGGGVISSITDTSGNVYHLVASTGLADNHTQTLYVAKDVGAASHLKVSVTFAGGDTTMGGSVAAIDVVGAASSPIDVKAKGHGVHDLGSVTLSTTSVGDLFLIGVSGQAKIANVTAGYQEQLINTAGADAGPFQDGEGFGTMWASGETGDFAFAFGLQNAAVWSAIVVGIR